MTTPPPAVANRPPARTHIVRLPEGDAYPVLSRYAETRTVRIDLFAVDGDEPALCATTELSWVALADDEVLIGNWADVLGIVEPLQSAGVIGAKRREDTMSGFSVYCFLLSPPE